VKRRIEVAVVALALLGVPLAVGMPVPAHADVHVSIDPGSVAFGYSDGYWDRDHRWHDWRNREETDWYREHYRDHYYNRKHDGEREQGWRSTDRWWDRH
jgi:hypothetical protein